MKVGCMKKINPLGRQIVFSMMMIMMTKPIIKISYHYHLRHALMTENHPFDVRLVYLAIHHILKHRGHFLFENFQVDENGVSGFEESFAAFGNALEHIKGESLDMGKEEEMKALCKDKNWG